MQTGGPARLPPVDQVRRGSEGGLRVSRDAFEVGKMVRNLVLIAAALAILAVVVAPAVATLPEESPLPNGESWKVVWEFLSDLQTQIYNLKTDLEAQIAAIPAGPQGPVGPQGEQGLQGEQGPAGATVHLGRPTEYDPNTWYTAPTDGFVSIQVQHVGSAVPVTVTFDWTNSLVTYSLHGVLTEKGDTFSYTRPIPAGEDWIVDIDPVSTGFGYGYSIWWTPLES